MVLDYTQPIPTPVKFDLVPAINLQIFNFMKGEGFFMRAWYEFDLLQKYGGVNNGVALGFPISKKYLTVNDNLDLPRNTYEECVQAIVDDCDSAAKYLPIVYSKQSGLLSDGTWRVSRGSFSIGATCRR